MRPTIEEQLHGSCRILEDVIAPCVSDAYARTMLAGLIGNLRMLGTAIPAVPSFLAADNRATGALLARMQAVVAPELATRIALAVAEPEPDGADMRLLDQRNGQLRTLLAQAQCDTDLTADLRAAALAYMGDRAARAPMRYVSTAAPAPKDT